MNIFKQTWSWSKRHWIITSIATLFLMATTATAITAYQFLHQMPNPTAQTVYIYIDQHDTAQSVKEKMGNPWGWALLMRWGYTVRTGRYPILPGEYLIPAFQRLRRGEQEPIKLVVPNVRTTQQLAAVIAKQTMLDSMELKHAFADSAFCARYGYAPHTLAAMFIPNTYELYWDISIDNFMKRMKAEHARFWTKERLQLAEQINLSPIEVATLASIIDSETNNEKEKPIVAGLYLNRLKKGMLLQSCPTVIFAQKKFSTQRLYLADLKFDSPYNTYLYAGLPPGPIRIPSISALKAVLEYEKHDYLYMCAKEDFSGTHNFAASYRQHQKNASLYAKALNERKIK